VDYEVRLLLLHNFKEGLVASVVHHSAPYFVRSEIAYRQRFNNTFNEVRFVFLGGFNFTNKFGVLIQDNISWNVKNISDFEIEKDANNMLTVSGLYRYNNKIAFQIGIIKIIHGNAPIYDNNGVVIGIWNALK
jgi:hypothetical protein